MVFVSILKLIHYPTVIIVAQQITGTVPAVVAHIEGLVSFGCSGVHTLVYGVSIINASRFSRYFTDLLGACLRKA
jgi:hypothetical protein